MCRRKEVRESVCRRKEESEGECRMEGEGGDLREGENYKWISEKSEE